MNNCASAFPATTRLGEPALAARRAESSSARTGCELQCLAEFHTLRHASRGLPEFRYEWVETCRGLRPESARKSPRRAHEFALKFDLKNANPRLVRQRHQDFWQTRSGSARDPRFRRHDRYTAAAARGRGDQDVRRWRVGCEKRIAACATRVPPVPAPRTQVRHHQIKRVHRYASFFPAKPVLPKCRKRAGESEGPPPCR